MGCDPVAVTGYVDSELEGHLAAAIQRHLALCAVCAAQAEFEIHVRGRLLCLPKIQPRPVLEARLRAEASRAMMAAN